MRGLDEYQNSKNNNNEQTNHVRNSEDLKFIATKSFRRTENVSSSPRQQGSRE